MLLLEIWELFYNLSDMISLNFTKYLYTVSSILSNPFSGDT